jgi:predicted ATPase
MPEPFISQIEVENLLSFGEKTTVELKNLNVLIGPNGSGKSNLIEVFRLLKSLPKKISEPFFHNTTAKDWVWKGNSEILISITCKINIYEIFLAKSNTSNYIYKASMMPREMIVFDEEIISELYDTPKASYHPKLLDDLIAKNKSIKKIEEIYCAPKITIGSLFSYNIEIEEGKKKKIKQISDRLLKIKIYTDTVFARESPVRQPQDASLDPSQLFEDYSNLALVLNDLQHNLPVKRAIIEKLKIFYEPVEDIITRVIGGTVQIYFQEANLTQTVPATRLSDGTLRYLCLLVMLMHPDPPPLICLEEPELGMHPDILPTIADLIMDASTRTQLIVTTHSPTLVSAIGEKQPEAIIVCEKDETGTKMNRLDPEKMKTWLDKYSLGELWTRGDIGGNRW